MRAAILVQETPGRILVEDAPLVEGDALGGLVCRPPPRRSLMPCVVTVGVYVRTTPGTCPDTWVSACRSWPAWQRRAGRWPRFGALGLARAGVDDEVARVVHVGMPRTRRPATRSDAWACTRWGRRTSGRGSGDSSPLTLRADPGATLCAMRWNAKPSLRESGMLMQITPGHGLRRRLGVCSGGGVRLTSAAPVPAAALHPLSRSALHADRLPGVRPVRRGHRGVSACSAHEGPSTLWQRCQTGGYSNAINANKHRHRVASHRNDWRAHEHRNHCAMPGWRWPPFT